MFGSVRLQKGLVERNLLKGITADENTAAHDIATLGVVNVRYCGYNVVVKVEERENDKKVPPLPYIELLDQPDGGAYSLNVNSLRLFLHKRTSQHKNVLPNLKRSENEELNTSRDFLEKLLKESLTKLQEECVGTKTVTRWPGNLELAGYNIYKTKRKQKKSKKIPLNKGKM